MKWRFSCLESFSNILAYCRKMSDKHCESCKCKCEEKKVESLPTVVEEVKKPKAKRVLSDAQKAVLAKGREKRLELLKSKKGAVETKEEVKEETKKEEVKEEPKVEIKPASKPIEIPKPSNPVKPKAKMIVKPYIAKPQGVRFIRNANAFVEF